MGVRKKLSPNVKKWCSNITLFIEKVILNASLMLKRDQ